MILIHPTDCSILAQAINHSYTAGMVCGYSVSVLGISHGIFLHMRRKFKEVHTHVGIHLLLAVHV